MPRGRGLHSHSCHWLPLSDGRYRKCSCTRLMRALAPHRSPSRPFPRFCLFLPQQILPLPPAAASLPCTWFPGFGPAPSASLGSFFTLCSLSAPEAVFLALPRPHVPQPKGHHYPHPSNSLSLYCLGRKIFCLHPTPGTPRGGPKLPLPLLSPRAFTLPWSCS